MTEKFFLYIHPSLKDHFNELTYYLNVCLTLHTLYAIIDKFSKIFHCKMQNIEHNHG